MCKTEIVDATAEHADRLVAEMRKADRDECEAAGQTPESAVLNSMGNSLLRKAVYFNGEFAGVYGIVPDPASTHLTPSCFAWFLSTPVVEKYPKTFFQTSLLATHLLTKKFGRLRNFVDLRYERSLDWLERIGFTVGPRAYPGPTGLRFVEVSREVWGEA